MEWYVWVLVANNGRSTYGMCILRDVFAVMMSTCGRWSQTRVSGMWRAMRIVLVVLFYLCAWGLVIWSLALFDDRNMYLCLSIVIHTTKNKVVFYDIHIYQLIYLVIWQHNGDDAPQNRFWAFLSSNLGKFGWILRASRLSLLTSNRGKHGKRSIKFSTNSDDLSFRRLWAR
jgi:hypothetical protein